MLARLGIMLIGFGMLGTAAANGQKGDEPRKSNTENKAPERQHSSQEKTGRETESGVKSPSRTEMAMAEAKADVDAEAKAEKKESSEASMGQSSHTTPDPCLKQPTLPQCK